MPPVLSQAWHSWKSAKGIALLAIIAFAVGLGATTATFTVINTVMLSELPYAEGNRFVTLYSARLNEPELRGSSTLADLAEYERRTTAFDVFGWFTLETLNIVVNGEPLRLDTASVTRSLAVNLGVTPRLGRWFDADGEVVISDRLARRLGGEAALLGQAVNLGGTRSLTIVGVMPAGFRLPVSGVGAEGWDSDAWLYLDPALREEISLALAFAYARRRPGVTLEQAEADVKRAASEIAALAPATHELYTARLDDLHDSTVSTIRPTLLLLFAAAALLLVIACANVAGLLLARAVARTRETATRLALGASRGQLARHYFVEGLLLSIGGGIAGVLLSIGLVRLVVAIAREHVARADEIGVEWPVLAFSTAAAVLASALASLAPLWQAVRTVPQEALGTGVRASTSVRARRMSHGLVVAEIALAFTLLGASAVLIAHMRALARISPGFDTRNLVTFEVNVPRAIATDPVRRRSYRRQLLEAIEAIPGVTSAAHTSSLPLNGCCFGGTIYPEGRAVAPDVVQRTSFAFVSPSYQPTMRIPLESGRFLEAADEGTEPVPVVVNRTAAERNWPGLDPIGRFGRFNTPDGSLFRVVGLVGDIRNDGLGKPPVAEVYIPASLLPLDSFSFVVRSSLPPASLAPSVRQALHGVDPTLPVQQTLAMEDIVSGSLVLERIGSFMTTFFASAALLMATLGVFGVISYGVRQRRVEIGTRMALGAAHRDVLKLIIGGGVRMAAYGVVIGGVAVAGATWLVMRWFNVQDVGWQPFVSSSVIVVGATAIASSIPAWRATLISPMVAIRDETPSLWQSAREQMRHVVARVSDTWTGTAAVEDPLAPELVGAVRSAASVPEMLTAALDTIRLKLGASSVLLFERASGDTYRCTAASPPESSTGDSLPADGFLLNRIRHHMTPLPISGADLTALQQWAVLTTLQQWDVEHLPARLAEVQTLTNLGVRMALPLRTKEGVQRVLLLGPPVGRADFSGADRRQLRLTADQFSLLVENARLTDRIVEQEKVRKDLALAAEVQKRLLPAGPPATTTTTLAAASLPARTVGGDYYDFIELGDHRIGVALADVAGKGVAAALIMSVVHASLRIISAEKHTGLPDLAERMNRFLYQSTGSNSYATFFYAELDESQHRLSYVNAGHTPPYLLRQGRSAGSTEIQELTVGGPVIGLLPEVGYEEGEIDLESGDLFVVFSDGVPEAQNPQGDEYGEDRLKTLIRQSGDLSAQEVVARISDDLRAWIKDAPQYDDMTFVVMKVST